jgi:hypothetical protein
MFYCDDKKTLVRRQLMGVSMSRTKQWLLFVVLLGIIALITVCASQRVAQPKWCPVPEQTARLEYDLPADSDGKLGVLAKALDDAVCLIRTDKPEECKGPHVDLPVCDLRSKEEVRELLKPAFDALASLKLVSPSSINKEIREQIPNATPMTRVRDARQRFDCKDWTKQNPCAAFKYDILWFLLERRAPGTGCADHIEIFLAEPACKQDIPMGCRGKESL